MLDLEIKLDDIVYQEVMHYVNKSNFEVSGLGKVVVEKDGDSTILRVTKVVILPQENTSVHTEIDPASIGKAEYDLRNEPGELRWWWHSHVKMETFWSNEDLNTIAELSQHDWFAATVFNQEEDMRSAYAQAAPLRFMMDEVLTYSASRIPKELTDKWDAQYAKNVKNKSTDWTKYLAGKGSSAMSRNTPNFTAKDDDDDRLIWPESVDDELDLRDRSGRRVRVAKAGKQDIDITDTVLEAAIDAGFNEEEAQEYADLAERLLEDGRYTASAIEHTMVQKILEAQALRERERA